MPTDATKRKPRVWSLLLCIVLLCGCSEMASHDFTNDDIIRESKKCRDAGLIPFNQRNWGGEVYKVTCEQPPVTVKW